MGRGSVVTTNSTRTACSRSEPNQDNGYGRALARWPAPLLFRNVSAWSAGGGSYFTSGKRYVVLKIN